MIIKIANMPRSCVSLLLLLLIFARPSAAQEVTFNQDIAPIIHRNCTPCHRPGEAAPFPLITYEDVARRASFVREVVESGYMPPWKPDGAYRSFAHERKLTPEEISLIGRWAAAKAPKGKGSVKVPDFVNGTLYHRKPDLTLKTEKPFLVKGDNEERFIVFKIPFELADSMNVEAMEFVSNNKKVVHHANFGIHPVEEGVDIHGTAPYVDLSGDDRRQFDQYLPYKKSMTYYGGWIPGTTLESYPAGMGWVMPKRGVILLTVHFAPTGKDEESITGVNLFFTKKPIERKVKLISIGSGGIGERDIDPFFMIQADTVKTFTVKVATPADQSLLYIWPHMHLLGKRFRAWAVTPQGDTVRLVDIPDWDFKWQEIYRFKQLVKVPKGSVLTVEGTYDNTSKNPNNPFNPPRMIFADGDMKTTQEMMTLIMVFLPYQPGDEQLALD